MDFKTIDSLGRIVIPSSIRKKLGIEKDSLFEINISDNNIVLSKIDVVENKNNEVLINILKPLINANILVTDLVKVVASTKEEMLNKLVSNEFRDLLEKRQKKVANGLQMFQNSEKIDNFLIIPILKNSILYGSIVIFLENIEKFNKNEIIIDLVIKLYLETYN